MRLDDVDAVARWRAQWAAANGKDARVVEVILRESRRIVRMDRGILITETHHGFVCANAGVDASNVRARIRHRAAARPGCLGRAAARRVVSAAFELSGRRHRRRTRSAGRGARASSMSRSASPGCGRSRLPRQRRPVSAARSTSTVIALADELAGAAEIVMRKTAGTPVAIVRGAADWAGRGLGRMLVRDAAPRPVPLKEAMPRVMQTASRSRPPDRLASLLTVAIFALILRRVPFSALAAALRDADLPPCSSR